MPLIRDIGLRASLYPKVEPLLHGLPKELAATGRPVGKGKETPGRYVRIELPGTQRTLTLAEVEVFSDGKNVARQGKASQKNTGYGGDANRAIDGNTDGNYNSGTQTHSAEGTKDPWWEVDLGREFPIDTIVIWNRTDGALGDRLNGFTLKVLGKRHEVVFEKTKQPIPRPKSSFAVGSESPERVIRREAMVALTSVRGQEGPSFKALALFVKEGDERPAALAALQRIPSTYWPAEEIQPLLDSLLAYVRKVPESERTSPPALDALQLADALAGSLPLDRSPQGPQGTGRPRRARHPPGHGARPDALRQGAHRGAGRQAGRVPLREHRPDAAQPGLPATRLPRGSRRARRSPGRAARSASSVTSCPPRPRSCNRAGSCSRVSRRS